MPNSRSKPGVFLVANATKPRVVETFGRLEGRLREKGLLVGTDLVGKLDTIQSCKPDFIITLGGDGTILHVVQVLQQTQIPIIGVNMGKLGYLADFAENELEQHLDQILIDPGLISERMMMEVRIITPYGEDWNGIALNDCVIRVGDPYRTISVAFGIDDHQVSVVVGDGVIVATPTGSTAHNMSCGGPIVQPGVDSLIVTPRCPHSFTQRPIVVSAQATVSLTLVSKGLGAAVVMDGQVVRPIPERSRIMITRAKEPFRSVRNPQRRMWWDTLITKLKWGQDVT